MGLALKGLSNLMSYFSYIVFFVYLVELKKSFGGVLEMLHGINQVKTKMEDLKTNCIKSAKNSGHKTFISVSSFASV